MSKRTYREKVIFWLDLSKRHIKKLLKQYAPQTFHHHEAIHMFGTMKTCCDILDINPLEWCKILKIPYKSRGSDYNHLFTSDKPNETTGKPMMASGYYNDLIIKRISTGE